jgi:hypothetical protein
MRTRGIFCVVLALCCLFSSRLFASTTAEWNFNSTSDDGDTATGSLTPSRGIGSFTFIGGVTSTFGTVGGGRTSDPAAADDSQLRVRTLPAIDAGNKTAGLELTFDSTSYENLTLRWDQYNSRTASRYWRVQYSIDGASWIDHQSVVNTKASTWVPFQVSLADIPDVSGEAALKIRIVQEFESTATGAGAEAYVAVDPTATYTTAGSWWLDMISVSSGPILPPNEPPVISAIPDLVAMLGTNVDSVPFTISDPETAPFALQIAARLSNPEVLSSLFINGGSSNRFLSFQAAKLGETEITLQVSDGAGGVAETTFSVIVVSEPLHAPPVFLLLWNFNSTSEDSDNTTGTFEPAIGSGNLAVIGAGNHNFGIVAQGRTSDPATNDNSMLRISAFPGQGESNRTSGIELRASTRGMTNLLLFWDQYNSTTASRHWRIQYTTNGSDFINFASFTNTAPSVWHRTRSISFKDIPGVPDNPNFAVRFVSEFSADGGYAAVSETSNYSTAGTLWLDMVGLSAERLPEQAEPEPEPQPEPKPEPEPPPALQFSHSPDLRLTWPLSARSYLLEAKENWESDWIQVEDSAEEKDGVFQINIQANGSARFFRLRRNSPP